MISGIVIHAEGLGKALGFPTANLDCSKREVKLATGVYAAHATVAGQSYHAALVIMGAPWKVEVHLLDYGGRDIYGELLQVDPVQKVSEVETYSSTEELIKKIQHDLVMVRELLTAENGK